MSLSSFLRNPSVFNNALVDTMRRRQGLSFRKTLGVYNFKVKPRKYYKNPHAIPLDVKEKLRDDGSNEAMRKINVLTRLSTTPFGKFTRRGNFRFDTHRVPNYNVPDMTDFQVNFYFKLSLNHMFHIKPQWYRRS
jgi:large subunit ribosomal protein L41